MSSTVIKVFNNSDNNVNGTNQPLNYFSQTLQSIFGEFRTTDDLILWIVVMISIGFGFLLNLLVMRSILRIKRNGTHYLVAQIIIADLIALSQMKVEIFYTANRSWLDPIEWCSIYLGIDAFTSTAIVFFIITLNFHTISTYNLACRTMAKNRAKLLQKAYFDEQAIPDADENDEEDDEFDDDDESNCDDSVVTPSSEKIHDIGSTKQPYEHYGVNEQRSIVIDYSKPKSRISVMLPVIVVWLLAASMSVPLFLYGRIIPSSSRDSNQRMCGLVQYEPNNSFLLQILLIKMRIVVPTLCLVLSTIYVIIKLAMAKRKMLKPSQMVTFAVVIDEDAVQILKLALSLALTFMLFSMQRIYGSLWFELISRPMMEYKYAQFDKWLGITGCVLHYAAIIVRPIIYWRFERTLWRDLKFGCCTISRRRR